MAVDTYSFHARMSNITVNIGNGNSINSFLFRANQAVTINGAWIVEPYTPTTAGTAWACQLLRYSSASTPVLLGTIGPSLGGTANLFAAGVPKIFTINNAHAVIERGEWVVARFTVNNGNATPSKGCSLSFDYTLGK